LWGLTNRGRLLYLQHPSARGNDWLAYFAYYPADSAVSRAAARSELG